MEQKVKIGLVARCDDSGLGVMSYDFFRNFYIAKTLIITARYTNHYDRYTGYEDSEAIVCQRGAPTLEEIDYFLEGLDLVIAIETPYNWNIFTRAKEKGIKTILIPMYEWTPPSDAIPAMPDLFLCPSETDLEEMPEPKQLLKTPVNRKIVPFRERTEAKTFIFNNGHGGHSNRNSLPEFLQAIPMVKSDVKFIVRSQVPFDAINDRRVQTVTGDVPYEDLWKEGDIYIHLHKFDGLSLPLNEALAAGFPVIAPNTMPHNQFLPKELLVEPDALSPLTIYRPIKSAVISPVKIAEMIDKVANMSSDEIRALSQKSNELAEAISWETLKPQYIETFNKLCGK